MRRRESNPPSHSRRIGGAGNSVVGTVCRELLENVLFDSGIVLVVEQQYVEV